MNTPKPKYWKCGPHMRGRNPGDTACFHSECVVCRKLLELGLRTGTEPLPPKRGETYFRMVNRALWKEQQTKKVV